MSFNKITFEKKKLNTDTFQTINFKFSNGHAFDVLFYKKDKKTHLVLEKKYLEKIMKYSFVNGGTYDQNAMQMFLPMISMMFLPVTGVFNLSTLKFNELYAGAIKTNLSSKLSSAFADEGKSEDDDDNKQPQSLIGGLFSNLKSVWQNDEEDEEDEELGDFLIGDNACSDDNNEKITTDEKTVDNKKTENIDIQSDLMNSMLNIGNIDDNNKTTIPRELLLFDISLFIDDDTDFISKINEKDPVEMYESGRQQLIKQSKEHDMSGVKNVEFFGENDENTRLTLMFEFDDVNYEYNVEDMIQIKEFLLKFANFIKSEDTIL